MVGVCLDTAAAPSFRIEDGCWTGGNSTAHGAATPSSSVATVTATAGEESVTDTDSANYYGGDNVPYGEAAE